MLRGLIGSLLHLDQSEIKSTVATNPIRLGEQIDNKTFILDINVLLNDDTNLNLEMQVINMSNWTDRSLSYMSGMRKRSSSSSVWHRMSIIVSKSGYRCRWKKRIRRLQRKIRRLQKKNRK